MSLLPFECLPSRYVWILNCMYWFQLLPCNRFSHPVSKLSCLKSFRLSVASQILWKFPFTATSDGGLHSICLVDHISFVRCIFLIALWHNSELKSVISQPINLFVATANQCYGPITTIWRDGQVVKHIPWSAFHFSKTDWECVLEASHILAVSDVLSSWQYQNWHVNRILIEFSNPFLLRKSRHFGEHSLPLKSSRQPGKPNAISLHLPSIVMQSMMGWKR